jgi:hypothetical protein
MACIYTNIGRILINRAGVEREFDWQQQPVIGLAVKDEDKLVILDQKQKGSETRFSFTAVNKRCRLDYDPLLPRS